VPTSPITPLARLASRSFQSFSEAVRGALDATESRLSDSALVVALIDYAEDELRILDRRGSGAPAWEPGTTFDLGASFGFLVASDRAPRRSGDVATEAPAVAADLGPEVASYVAAPIELSDGNRVGILCALSGAPERYGECDFELLTIVARILAHEWERVHRDLELRRLREQLREVGATDPLTGFHDRAALLTALDREWQLTQRGTVSSYVAVIAVDGLATARERFGPAMADLLLRDAARALGAVARGTDIVGRVGGERFAVVLVGCAAADGVMAFESRLRVALSRVTGERPVQLGMSLGAQALADSASAVEALEAAELPVLANVPQPS